jgi:hypothetical protein
MHLPVRSRYNHHPESVWLTLPPCGGVWEACNATSGDERAHLVGYGWYAYASGPRLCVSHCPVPA